MAILTNTSQYPIWILGVFFSIQCACLPNSKNNLISNPQIDSLISNVETSNLFNSETILKGIHFMNLSNGDSYYVLADSNNVTIMDVTDSSKKIKLNIYHMIDQIACKDSSILCFNFTENLIYKTTFLKGNYKNYEATTIEIPKIFNDSIFCYNIYSAPVVAIDTTSFLIPYRAFNETPNMIDGYSTIFLFKKNNNYTFKKIIPFAKYIRTSYDYYKSVILAYDSKSKKILYTFQKSNFLYSLSIIDDRIDSVEIENFVYNEYDSTKIIDRTYLRKYISETDVNTNIVIDDSSKIYLLKKNRKENRMKYEISIFSNKLEKLNTYETKQKLFSSFAFTKKNKLFILNSSNSYFIFCFP
jgi:hypothetical protein